MTSLRSHSLALAVFAAAAVVLTWPLAAQFNTVLAAPQGAGDPYLNVWILGWDLRAWTQDPGAVLSGRVFDANIFHPSRTTLAYSDHLLLQSAALVPLYLATGSVVLCYNALLLLSLVASAWAMFALIRTLTGDFRAAVLAGLVWGFWPYHFAHLIHVQLQGLYFVPLAFLFLHRVMAGSRWRDACLLGVMVALSAATSVYYGVIGAVGLSVAAVVLAAGVGRLRNAALWTRLALAVVVGAVLVAPFVWPYLQVQRREGFARNLYQASLNAARPRHYAQVPPDNLLYGRTGLLRPGAAAGSDDRPPAGPERELFVGFAIVALAAAGLWTSWRRNRHAAAMMFLGVAATGFVLSLGPEGVRPLYAFLHDHVFGFQAIRAPARFSVLVTFGLAGLAALGLTSLGVSRPRVAWLAIACVLLEYANAPLAWVPAPASDTPVSQWLARADGPGAVVYLPLGLDADNTPFMVESVAHGRPIVNGYSGQRPSVFPGLVDTLRSFPDAASLWTLRDLAVRFVVSPHPIETAAGVGPLIERARIGGRTIYELVWTEEAERATRRPDEPLPPPPGPLPFGIGEIAVYDIGWQGAGAGVPAGTVTFAVLDAGGTPDAPLRLDLVLETAPWVSPFFEAQDRLWTTSTADLLPVEHRQEIREGRRRLDRAALFDPSARVVRTGGGDMASVADGVALPLASAARDPIAAFYYARTLDLPAGAEVRFPVNDMGRSLAVTVRAGGVESIVVSGRPASAQRLDVQIDYRVERRQSPRGIVWISVDGRRIPLLLEVDAGFGSFRGTLVRYVPPPVRASAGGPPAR